MSISIYTCAAICGNFYGESGVNPAQYEHGTNITDLLDPEQYGGYGLGQWTNKSSIGLTRRTQLIEWMDEQGYPRDSGDGEIAFLIYEDYWHQNYGEYATLTEFLENTSTNIEYLTRVWVRCWEGITPSSSSWKQRKKWANEIADYIDEHFDDPDIDWTAVSTSSYGALTKTQMKNNSVMVARALTNGVKPPKPKKTSGMPIWMYLRKV